MKNLCITASAVLLFACEQSSASLGDRSYAFQKCLRNCSQSNCTDVTSFEEQQPKHLKILGWTCYAECQYSCMWHTVDAFIRDGSPVPQFYGKWPFIRVFGIQEPASVVFSILNAAGHLMVLRYRALVSSSTPMYYVWHGMALIAVNAWTWSTIYHTRDTDFTEMMDYFFALSIVLYNVFAVFCRCDAFGTDKWWRPTVAGVIMFIFYLRHVHYLAYVKFDYGYNMKVNVAVGLCSIIGWVAWCIANRRHPYVWQCAVAMLGINILALLELLDFPPLFWALDAHSLWHAGTAPVNLLWWKFIIDDGIHLQKQLEEKKKIV
ncbi:hypothetical protein BaRGS_00029412 [Batillaria attramentaria]|uniref:Post-GPI attachment to proteins factor 3 n=1 Tax=Batillaria attramentaria TaxID=370345 RepID=A0ABD0JX50_9CAEN